jgi:hypothetical protein
METRRSNVQQGLPLVQEARFPFDFGLVRALPGQAALAGMYMCNIGEQSSRCEWCMSVRCVESGLEGSLVALGACVRCMSYGAEVCRDGLQFFWRLFFHDDFDEQIVFSSWGCLA